MPREYHLPVDGFFGKVMIWPNIFDNVDLNEFCPQAWDTSGVHARADFRISHHHTRWWFQPNPFAAKYSVIFFKSGKHQKTNSNTKRHQPKVDLHPQKLKQGYPT